MHWADDPNCVPYDCYEEEELPDESFYWEDYLLEEEADFDEDISILCKICYINVSLHNDN